MVGIIVTKEKKLVCQITVTNVESLRVQISKANLGPQKVGRSITDDDDDVN